MNSPNNLVTRSTGLPELRTECQDRQLPVGTPDNNAEPLFACVIVADASASTWGRHNEQINAALQEFTGYIEADDLTASYAQLALVRCGGGVSLVQDFVRAGDFRPPRLEAGGATPLGEALLVAMDLLLERQRQLDQWGFDQRRPWIFVVTDGAPTDPTSVLASAAQRVRRLEREKQLAVFAAYTEESDPSALRQLVLRKPLPLRNFDFAGMLRWLAVSMRQVSHSRLNEPVALPDPSDFGWTLL